MATFTRKVLHKKRAIVITDVMQDYSIELSNAFFPVFEALGGKTITAMAYTSRDSEFSELVDSIKGKKPDVLYIPGYYSEVGKLIHEIRRAGITVPILGGDGWDSPELVTGKKKDFKNCYFSNHSAIDDTLKQVRDFVAKYKRRFNQLPTFASILGYDAANMLADAIKRAGSTNSNDILAALASTTTVAGITGAITIDSNRNALQPVTIQKIVNGSFKYAEKVVFP